MLVSKPVPLQTLCTRNVADLTRLMDTIYTHVLFKRCFLVENENEAEKTPFNTRFVSLPRLTSTLFSLIVVMTLSTTRVLTVIMPVFLWRI